MTKSEKIRPEDVEWGELPDDVAVETDDTVEEVDPQDLAADGELSTWLQEQAQEFDRNVDENEGRDL